MEKVVKALSHQDRVFGRVISGGSQMSLSHEMGKTLAIAIRNGFFEKKTIEGIRVHQQLYLPFTLFNVLRETSSN